MSGICSAHGGRNEPTCAACQIDLRDDPIFMAKVAEAEAAGTHLCSCGFLYYKTVDSCPKCNKLRRVDRTANEK